MCDCFHLAFPNWHASSGTGAGRRLRGPEHGAEDDSTCEEPSQFVEGERPRPQGSSPVEEYPEKYTDSDKEGDLEHDPAHKAGSGKKSKKAGLGSLFDKRSTPKMSKLKEVHSPESGVIVNTTKDGCAEGLVVSGGGKEGIFIKEVVPESPASRNLSVKEGDQILSATVYFDNVTYEDALQILEHAQAYKVKLCLKRKPDTTESEPDAQPDIIYEDEASAPKMRGQGKTKRHGDARISWPKLPSFGKGRKSHFTRSHSSSEADEHRKLELSPTTSDTESPIKSQDALKGQRKSKVKLSILRKKGRINSSEDQDTNTTGPVNRDGSPSGETPHVCVKEDLKVNETEQKDLNVIEPEPEQHKVELISLDSTLKTADLTEALAGQESPSGGKKKKKKEKSELKMRIMGKDKSHKQDVKAKSPKRLQTLGASMELASPTELSPTKKSPVIPSVESHTELEGQQMSIDPNTQATTNTSFGVISAKTQEEINMPKVELSFDMPDVGLLRKTSQKGKERQKKDAQKLSMDRHKDTKSSFRLPKICFTDIATEDSIKEINVNVNESTTKVMHVTMDGTKVEEDPYDRLSKSGSKTQLPKREDIEIPGMEDISLMRATARGIKEPKGVFSCHAEEIQAETVQMSIDVDSVKEAVSKLPGFKLPKVDMSGVPIPEEITMIDANAQRITVKTQGTPTKVLDVKTKQETHFTEFNVKASPEIVSRTTVKLPKFKPGDSSFQEFISETKVDEHKIRKEYKSNKREDILIPGEETIQKTANRQAQEIEKTKDIDGIQHASDKKSKITMPSFGITKPDIRFPDVRIDLPKQKGDKVKEERSRMVQEIKKSKTETSLNEDSLKVIPLGIPHTLTADAMLSDNALLPSELKYSDSANRDILLPKELEMETIINNEQTKKRGSSKESPSKHKLPSFKLPKFGNFSMKGKGAGVTSDIIISESKMSNEGRFEASRDGSLAKTDAGHAMKGFGIDLHASMPRADVYVTQPEIKVPEVKASLPELDVSLSKENVDLKSPEGKGGIQLPDTELKEPFAKVEIDLKDVDGSPARFKMPTFKLPKVGGGTPYVTVEVPDMDKDIKMEGADVNIPKQRLTADITGPSIDIVGSSMAMESKGYEGEGKGSMFKMPNLDISMPKLKGPEFDISISKKDVDVTAPEAKAEIKLPDFEVKGTSGTISVPDTSPLEVDAKFKKSRFALPKFSFSKPNIKGPEFDANLPEVDVSLPEGNVQIKEPELEIKPPESEVEIDGQGSKFKMPKFGILLPKVKGPEIDVSISKKDADITLPEAKAEVQLPDIKLKEPSAKVEVAGPEIKLEGKGSKFKMPNLGISMPKVKGPQIDISSSKKNIDVILPETKAEVKLPEIDVKGTSAVISVPEEPTLEVDAKLKKPKLSAPEMSFSKPNINASKVDVNLSKVDLSVTKSDMDIEAPEIEVELAGQESKFKMPKFGISLPKVKGPEIDLSLSRKDVDITLPEAKAEVKLPDVELKQPSAKVEVKGPEIEAELKDVEGSPSKFKMPTFKLPKFGASTSNVTVEVPDMDKHIKIDGAELKAPKAAMDITAPNIEVEGPSIDVISAENEFEGKGYKFKMPSLGISMPKVKGPAIDLSSSKKDVDITLPEAKAEVRLPDVELKEPSAKVEVKLPEIEVKKPSGAISIEVPPAPELDGKFKKPRFSLPKFSFSKQSIKEPEADINSPEVDVSLPEGKTKFKQPEVEVKPPDVEVELDGQGSGFKMPKFGISLPKVKGPEIDLSLSRKDVDITLPEAKAEVKLPDVELKQPSAKVEVKGPEIEAELKDVEGSPSKFKMPTFKLPKFGVSTSNVTVEVPDMDRDIKIDGAELKAPKAAMDITAPNIEVEGPSIDVISAENEFEGKGYKFKMPNLGISMPKVKGPTIDLSSSKKDVDITLPEAKAEVRLPDVELKEPSAKVEVKLPEIEVKKPSGAISIEVPPAPELDGKFKKPRFSLPKFSFSKQSIKEPEADVNIPEVDVSLPEGKTKFKQPEVEVKPPDVEVELDGQGSGFKMPKFGISLPKVKGPEIDLSLSRKDVDITLPEAKAEVKLPDVELKQPSAKVEVKGPEIEAELKDVDGSPSKFKMPTFKLPKFGATTSKVTVEVPDMGRDINIDGAELKAPKAAVDITAPNIEVEGPSIDVKTAGVKIEERGSKFKMPNLGISMPKVKGPEIDLSLSKKDVDITLPEAEFKLPDVELKEPSGKVEIKGPKIEAQVKDVEGSPSRFKMPTLKLPTFGSATPSVTVEAPKVDKELHMDGAELKMPTVGVAVDITAPSVDIEGPSLDVKTKAVEIEGKGSKLKMPHFGISMPKVKGPEIDLSLSKKDVDVTLPEAKAEVKLGDVEVKEPLTAISLPDAPAIEVDGKMKKSSWSFPSFSFSKTNIKSPDVDINLEAPELHVTLPEAKTEVHLPDVEVKEPTGAISIESPAADLEAKLKKSKFSLPKFSFSKPSVKESEIDVNLPHVDVSLPEGKVEVKEPEVEIKSPAIDIEVDGQGSKFKMPKFGISLPKVKGPEIDLSLSKTDVDITLPEAKGEVKLPDVELKQPSAKVEVKSPEIEGELKDFEGSPSKFKMPTFKLPKFGASTSKVIVEVPDMDQDIKIDGAELKAPQAAVDITAPNIEVEGPSIDVKSAGVKIEEKGSKFKMPHLGISMPKVKGPEIDLSLSKKDVDITLPEAKAEVKLPDVELKGPSAKVEVKAPEIQAQVKDVGGSPSKFKMPTLKLPKFGSATPNVTVEVPEMDKEINIDGAELKIPREGVAVDITAPSVNIEKPSVDVKTKGVEIEGKGSKLKMPHFGISMPKVKGPEIDLSLSKKDVDVTLPEAEVKLGEVEVKEPSTAISLPDAPAIEVDGKMKKSSWSFPSFSFSKTNIKSPDVDINLEAPELHVTLPEAKTEVHLPDVEVKEPTGAISIEEPPVPELEAKLKKPKFSLPRFSFSKPSVKEPEIAVDLPHVDVSLPEGKVEVKEPEVEIKPPAIDIEVDGQGSKFKMPKFGISLPKVKGPEIDLSLSKTDVDITLPEAKAEVKLPDVELKQPSAKVDVKGPEIEGELKDVEGSPSKFKMPTFKLPKFGASTSNVTVEVPDMDRDITIDGAELKAPKAAVDITAPNIEVEGPSIDVKTAGVKIEEKGSGFKMPKFGISLPKVKGPEIDLSLSKKDVDITLPEAKAEVKLPDVELKQPSAKVEIKGPEIEAELKDVEGSPSKFKMPTFKLPKFGASTSNVTVEVPDLDKHITIDGAELKAPKAAVDITAPNIEVEGPSIDVKTAGVKIEEKGSGFKMPKFGISLPKVKGPEIDLSLSKKDVDITLPEAKAEVKLPDVELKQPSAKVDVKGPEIEAELKDVEGSPSKFKMPTFKLPKFGASTSKVIVEVPDMDQDIKIDGAELKSPKTAVDITAPNIEVEGPSIDVKSAGVKIEEKGSKFKMPNLGMSMPKVKGPEIDLSLSKKHVDITLPEAKAEVKLPDVELKQPSVKVEVKRPEIETELKDVVEGSPSKFKMPTFKLPKFGAATPNVTVEVPDMGRDIKIDGAELKAPKAAVDITAPNIEVEGPSIDVKIAGGKIEEKGGKFKMPNLGMSMPKVKGPDIDLSLSKKDVDITLPQAKAEVKVPNVELREPSVKIEVKDPEIETELKDVVEGSPSKFKMPTFKLPKFGASTSNVTVEVPVVDKEINIDGAEMKTPKEGVAFHITAPSIDMKGPSTDMKTTGIEIKGTSASISVPQAPTVDVDAKMKKPSWSLPRFSFSKTKSPELEGKYQSPDLDVRLPEAKTEIPLQDIEVKEPSGTISVEEPLLADPDAKLKMPKFSLSKFSFSKSSVKEPDAGVNLQEMDVSLRGGNVEVKQPEVEIKVPQIDIEQDEQESKLKMPKFGISLPKVKGPEIDLSLSKKDVVVTLPEAKAEVKLPEFELKDPSKVEIESPRSEVQSKDVQVSPSKFKMPTFKLPKFGVGIQNVDVEVPDMDKDTKIIGADMNIPKDRTEVDVTTPSIAIKVPSIDVKTTEPEGKGSKFKMPNLGLSLPKGPEISKPTVKPEVDVNIPEVNDSLPKGKVEVKQTETGIKTPEIDLKDVEGSPSKFKMPSFKFSKFGVASPNVTVEVPELDKDINVDGAEINISKKDTAVDIKVPSVDIKADMSITDHSKQETTALHSETPETETDIAVHGSPSKFKLPSFKMPKLSFSKHKPEDEYLPVDTEYDDNKLETEVEQHGSGTGKSPKLSLTLGEILKTIDVEFDVPTKEETEEKLTPSKEEIAVPGPNELNVQSVVEIKHVQKEDEMIEIKSKPKFKFPKLSFSRSPEETETVASLNVEGTTVSGKQSEVKEKETNIKQESVKSPERAGWLKFPKFGLSSPSEPVKKEEKKSPVGDTADEDLSTTSSVHSSDAFADISSTVTSEQVGLSLSSPTKVTVKYSDPNVSAGLGEVHSNVITSTTKTELISVEPNLPEKITILSSGASSSSLDTLKLESGKIHVITSNIQATPEAQHATLLTDFQLQSAGGNTTVFQRQVIREVSSESRETVLITKKVTHVFGVDPGETDMGETASSLQRLRDSMHSEKMKFFDGAKK